MAGKYDDQYVTVDEMIAHGSTVRQASDATGVPAQSIYQRIRKSADPKPGGNAKRATKHTTKSNAPVTDEQLTAMLTKVAAFPAFPMRYLAPNRDGTRGCAYCANHFASTAPQVAADMVALANEYPWLRESLEDIQRWVGRAAIGGMLGLWIGVPLGHHLLTPEMFMWLAIVMELPLPNAERNSTANGSPPWTPQRDPGPQHVHVDGTTEDAPAPTPFAGMDLDSLMAMARMGGITVQPPTPPADDPEDIADAYTTETLSTDDTIEYPAGSASENGNESHPVEADATDSDGRE